MAPAGTSFAICPIQSDLITRGDEQIDDLHRINEHFIWCVCFTWITCNGITVLGEPCDYLLQFHSCLGLRMGMQSMRYPVSHISGWRNIQKGQYPLVKKVRKMIFKKVWSREHRKTKFWILEQGYTAINFMGTNKRVPAGNTTILSHLLILYLTWTPFTFFDEGVLMTWQQIVPNIVTCARPCFVMACFTECPFQFCDYLTEEKIDGFFTLIAFLLLRDS